MDGPQNRSTYVIDFDFLKSLKLAAAGPLFSYLLFCELFHGRSLCSFLTFKALLYRTAVTRQREERLCAGCLPLRQGEEGAGSELRKRAGQEQQ